MMIDDEPGAALPGCKGPNPLRKHAQADPGHRDKLEMHSCPDKPHQKSTERNFATLQNGEASADHGHISFVKIAKRRRRSRTVDA